MKKTIKVAVLASLLGSSIAFANNLGSMASSPQKVGTGRDNVYPRYPVKVMIINDTPYTLYVNDYANANFIMGPGWKQTTLMSDQQSFAFPFNSGDGSLHISVGCSPNSNGYTNQQYNIDSTYTIQYTCELGARAETIRINHPH